MWDVIVANLGSSDNFGIWASIIVTLTFKQFKTENNSFSPEIPVLLNIELLIIVIVHAED